MLFKAIQMTNTVADLTLDSVTVVELGYMVKHVFTTFFFPYQ